MSWELSLFDEERPYGPKDVESSRRPAMHNRKSLTAPADNLASAKGSGDWHPMGAPPLDWWVIDE